MSQQSSLDALSAQVDSLATAVSGAVTEIHTLAAQLAALISSGAIDDSTQLDAIRSRLADLGASLGQAVTDATSPPTV